ncbi:protein rhomboid [Bacillus rossius redtenbacheri]|uniref:protein rhomboid n=1 Tax=Bacillus rossius redtenbacheri TaxID=93214 RepID=UPI002FDE6781
MAAAEVLVQLLPEDSPPPEPPPPKPRWRPPFFILLASCLEVLVYVGADARSSELLIYSPCSRAQLWRFLSYMLLHSDSLHLSLNVAVQCVLAAPLEHEQGHWRTAAVYLAGGVAGSLGTSVLEPDLYLMGSSGGVYALLISQLSNILLNYRALSFKAYRAGAVALLAGSDVAFTLHHYSRGNTCPRIGWSAHCSGAAAGLLAGLVVFSAPGEDKQAASPRSCGYPRLLAWAAAVVLLSAFAAAVADNLGARRLQL